MMSMIKIKSIKKLRKKYEVTIEEFEGLDDKYVFCEDTIVKYMILKDHEFEYEDFLSILKEEKAFNSLNLALNFLSYQSRSEKEIINHLKEKEIENDSIASTIKKLKELKYIDDKKLSMDVTKGYANRLKGPNYIKQVLIDKGIDNDLINQALDLYDVNMEIEGITKLALKEKDKYSKYPIKKQKQMLSQKLLNAGFHLSSINYVIHDLELNDNSFTQLNKDYQKLVKKYEKLDDVKKKQKIVTSLMNKGYEYSQIKSVIE